MIRTAGVIALFLAMLWQLPVQAESEMKPKVGVQLYSVRDALQADFEGTLRALAEMGFDGVEFYGGVYGPYVDEPVKLKAFLESLGLESAGSHVASDDLSEANLAELLRFHQALGSPALVVGMDKRAWSKKNVYEFSRELNRAAKGSRGTGIRVGYHNHDKEFRSFKNSTFWDVLAENTLNEVVLQLDVGWATHADIDAAAYVRKYPGRTFSTHYKVHKPLFSLNNRPFIGEGETDWNALLDANFEVGGTQWLLVEQEAYPDDMTPLQAVEESLKGLQKLLADREKSE
ncbi:sugar phosphate isomerase/epimerase [Halioglobus maricola]|uniref:Sugar phosphate isomerase/epimerase n=1 Tax=Halioglobus maricola TaxID=2601894 RepID=A0A5P9NM31_9GAMM|nr:sugar phosphate isomerase/epimerase [Halioglobus maricola]QFU76871.1 sugar phosphate isomerase/epimerase [Halioglobus maricola]